MAYIQNNLISGESVTYRAKLHWIVMLKSIVAGVVVVVIGGLVFYTLRQQPDYRDTSTPWYAILITLFVAAIPLAIAQWKRNAAEFAVTNKRVIFKVGALGSQTVEMFLNKIESVNVDQSVGGRILGYGSIAIRGTGGSLEPFHLISRPLEFRRQIQEQIGRSSR